MNRVGLSLRALLAFTATACALLGYRLLEPLGRDQAVFYVLARELWRGVLPYRDLFEHKPPGILLVYALAERLDGCAGWGISLLDTLATGCSAWLLSQALAVSGERRAGLWAGAIYVATARAAVFGGFWATGQPEVFQDLCVAALLYFGVRGAWWRVGLAISAALLLKFTYIGLLPVALLWAGRPHASRVLGGVAVPTLLLGVVMLVTGALGPAWQAIIEFNLRHAQTEVVPWSQLPGVLFAELTKLTIAVPAALLAGVVGLRWSPASWPRQLLRGMALAALAQVLVQRKLWDWHWNPLLLPLSAAAGLGWARLAMRSRRLAFGLCGLLLLPTLALAARSVARVSSAPSHQELLRRYTWGDNDFTAARVEALGQAIRARAGVDDRLLVWGFEPGIYLSSGLQPGTRFLYDYPLSVGFAPQQRQQALHELLQALPHVRYWLVLDHDQNALERLSSRDELLQLPALREAWTRDYVAVGRLFNAELFERRK